MKKALITGLVVLSLLGAILVTSILGASMQPSEKEKSARSQHYIANLKVGQYLIEPFGRDTAWNEKVLIIRDWDSSIYTYLLPTENEKFTMPDRWWGWGYYHCTDFRPEVELVGTIRKNGIIKCHDNETPEWGASLWEWSYNGKPVIKWGIDMYSPTTEVVNGTLYINH